MSAVVSDYEALKAYGHSPAKAAEIVLDAKRGDFFSKQYLAFVKARGDLVDPSEQVEL